LSPDFSNLVQYVRNEYRAGRLDALSERAKVSKDHLYRIAKGIIHIDEETALCLAFVTEPQDDQWQLDPDDPGFFDVPNLTDAEMIARLQTARDVDKLGVVAAVSGVKGGKETLEAICDKGLNVRLDPVTRSLLLNVME